MALAPERLSRFLTFLLRHKPKEYPLSIDREGFAPWQEVVDFVQERFYDVSEEQIRSLIAGGEKKRFELRGDKVRATYGHSFPIDLGAEEAESVAKRHDPSPAIIVIAARAAHDEGIQFYASGPLFLVEQVPPKFLSLR